MRRKKKTTIITVEARERMTVRHGVQQMTWCEQCGAEVLMVTPDEAAVRFGIDARTVFRGVESGEFHFCEGANGRLLVCSESVRTRGN